MKPSKCTKCGMKIDVLDTFPGNLCLPCYAAKMDKVPLDKLDMPDFTGTIKKELLQ